MGEFKIPVFSPKDIIRSPNRLKPDYNELAAMCSVNATISECALMQKTTPNVLNTKMKLDFGLSFNEYKEIYKPAFTFMIRQTQMKKLASGDARTVQWMSQNYLGQTPVGAKEDKEDQKNLETEDLLKIVSSKESKVCLKSAKKRKEENESIKPISAMELQSQKMETSNPSESPQPQMADAK